VGLERGPLSLLRIAEELLEWISSSSGSSRPRLTAVGIRCADHAASSIRKSWNWLNRQSAAARSVWFACGLKPRSSDFMWDYRKSLDKLFQFTKTNEALSLHKDLGFCRKHSAVLSVFQHMLHTWLRKMAICEFASNVFELLYSESIYKTVTILIADLTWNEADCGYLYESSNITYCSYDPHPQRVCRRHIQ
jgi:hypothetical protein